MSVHAVSESEFEAVKAAALSGLPGRRRNVLPLLLAWTSLVVSNPALITFGLARKICSSEGRL